MERLRSWLRDNLARRPWWMNVVMFFCMFATLVYVPWDFFFKPVEHDQEAWFGFLLHGRAAKLTEPLHWAIYAAGWYGFWRMRSWMWPWAALYAGQIALGMFVWAVVYHGGIGGFTLGLVAAAPFVVLTRALWDARRSFEEERTPLSERYGGWALVTGASAGIGAEYARALARDRMSCVLVARREDRMNELAEELTQAWGVETRIVVADLADDSGVTALRDAVSDLDVGVLINNAGVGYAGAFEKQDADRLDRMIRLNCSTPVAITRALLPAMLSRGRGAIVVVGSSAARQPVPLMSVYAATKAFDLSFGEALWVELRGRGIDVQVVQPGPVATEFEEVAGEKRADPELDQSAYDVVRVSLETLGTAPSVATSWRVFALGMLGRFLPRTLVAFVAASMMERQTPPEMR